MTDRTELHRSMAASGGDRVPPRNLVGCHHAERRGTAAATLACLAGGRLVAAPTYTSHPWPCHDMIRRPRRTGHREAPRGTDPEPRALLTRLPADSDRARSVQLEVTADSRRPQTRDAGDCSEHTCTQHRTASRAPRKRDRARQGQPRLTVACQEPDTPSLATLVSLQYPGFRVSGL